MVDMFKDARGSIEFAEKRVAELEAEFRSFFEEKPYTPVTQVDPDGVTKTYKIVMTKELPASFSFIAREIFSHLRSSLDHMAYQCAEANAAGSGRKGAKFPFGQIAQDANFSAKGCKNIPKEVLDVMFSFKPYNGGDDLLAALNKVRNTKTHEVLIPFGTASIDAGIEGVHIRGVDNSPVQFRAPVWDSTKNELVLFRGSAKFSYNNVYFSLSITFGDIEIIGGQEAFAVLHTLVDKVKEILSAVESVTASIGLVRHP